MIRRLLTLLILGAVCAQARTAFAFEVLSRPAPEPQPHRAAYACALAGAGLIAVSFPLTNTADRRYAEYRAEGDVSKIESRWNRSVWADRAASGAMLGGEALLVAAVYLRFLRAPTPRHVALELGATRCGVSYSF